MKADVSIVDVTSKMASEWLDNIFDGQRKVRDTHVSRLATEIIEGRWKLSCDAWKCNESICPVIRDGECSPSGACKIAQSETAECKECQHYDIRGGVYSLQCYECKRYWADMYIERVK